MGDLTTHPECQALLRAILTDPADDLPRLLYADWLEETGEGERAEFIRVQVEIARSDGCRVEGKVINWRSPMRACRDVFPDPHEGKGWGPHCNPCHKVVRLRRRERELLVRHWPRWWDDLPGVFGEANRPNGLDFEKYSGFGLDARTLLRATLARGFVNSIALAAADFLAHAAALFAAQPITEVRLTDRQPLPPSRAGRVSWVGSAGSLWSAEFIPEFLYKHLPHPHQNCFSWPSLDAAHAALSRACVAYGRELVGLPPLSEETKR